MRRIMIALFAVLGLLGVFAGPASAYDTNEVAEVQSWYQAIGSGNGDSGGVAYWANRFDGHNDTGCSINRYQASVDMRAFLSASGAMNTSNSNRVSIAYKLVLGRNADSGGHAYWLGRLNSGTSWQAMVNNFTYSSEYLSTKIQGNPVPGTTIPLANAPRWDATPC